MTPLFITCTNNLGTKIYEKSHQVIGFNYVNIYYACDISLKGHVISTALPLKIDTSVQIRSININLIELIDIGREEVKDFVNFIERKLLPETRTIHLVSAKEKYNLHVLSEKRSIFNKIITAVAGAIGFTVSILVLVSLLKLLIKILNRRKEKSQPHISVRLHDLRSFDNTAHSHDPLVHNLPEIAEDDHNHALEEVQG